MSCRLQIYMATRGLYIAAYDVADPNRLRKVHQVVKGYATGGQKSVFECFLSPRERTVLISQVRSIIDERQDRFAILQIQEKTKPILLGIATPVVDPDFYYVG